MKLFLNMDPLLQTFIATLFTWSITALGSLTVFLFKKNNKKVLDTTLGFSSGVMIAASIFSLLIPSIDLSKELGYIKWLFPSLGFLFGCLFVYLSDNFLDKSLTKQNSKERFKRCALIIFAITVHNIPEGMSIGVAFGGAGSHVSGMTSIGALMLAIGIGIQNFPEGAAVSLPLKSEGLSNKKSFLIGQASALVEPISAIIGFILVFYVRQILPFLLSFASGAMIMVVTRELIPESAKDNKNLSTIGFIIGFVIMMILDVMLS